MPSHYSMISMPKRAMATAAGSKTKTQTPTKPKTVHATPLSSALRKFYLKVHPDLFTGHPKEQESNEKSFKTLTEYLENYKSDVDIPIACPLEFFVRGSDDAQSHELKRVTAVLPPITKHSSYEYRAHILKQNLTRLFRQCDYHDEIDVSGYGSISKKLRTASDKEISIVSILMAASARFKGAANKQNSAQDSLEQIKETLKAENKQLQDQLSKEYKFKFAVEVPAMYFKSPVDRLKLVKSWLSNLSSAMEELSASEVSLQALKTGKTIIFAHRKQGPLSETDLNVIFLDVQEPRSSWVDTLSKISPTNDKAVREKFARKAKLEQDVAAAIGLKKVECAVEIALNDLDAYITLLERLHMHAMAKPQEWQNLHADRRRMNLRIVRRIDGVIATELTTSTLLFPFDRNVTDLLGAFQEHGPKIIQESREFEKAITVLRDRLELQQLVVHPEVSPENAVDAVNRLMDGFRLLQSYLPGINLCIANDYSVNEDTKVVFVKYDFLF